MMETDERARVVEVEDQDQGRPGRGYGESEDTDLDWAGEEGRRGSYDFVMYGETVEDSIGRSVRDWRYYIRNRGTWSECGEDVCGTDSEFGEYSGLDTIDRLMASAVDRWIEYVRARNMW